jgi:hypothetical protein
MAIKRYKKSEVKKLFILNRNQAIAYMGITGYLFDLIVKSGALKSLDNMGYSKKYSRKDLDQIISDWKNGDKKNEPV